ncbi:MAG: hypothetical protein JXQ75_05225 [Phycisphaerae bacterium]|nr:hypothetical protein [Phycisphaerae bacterium]
MIELTCAECGKHIRVDDKYAGKRGKCPGCGAAVVVPAKAAAIAFSCSHCGHTLKVPSSYAGKKGKCPKCQHAVVVPSAQEKPAAEAPAPTIVCSACGAAIPVTPGATDEFIECPTCGSYVDATSGAAPSPYGEAPAADDEGVDGTSEEDTEEGGGLNRRLVLILAGAAVVLIAVIIGVVVLLKSSGPPPAPARPIAQRAPRQTTETNPEPQTVAAETQPTTAPTEPSPNLPAEPAAVAPLRLRFAPPAGVKRTVRVATRALTSTALAGQQQTMGGTETFTLDLEAAPAQADGTVPVTIAIAAVRVESQIGATVSVVYDSDRPEGDVRGMAAMYAGFVGRHFTANISERGEIVGMNLDGLSRAAAEQRVENEDAQIRAAAPSPENAEQAIARANERYGSRAQRIAALQQQSEKLQILGAKKITALVGALVTFLPDSPARPGDRWDRPLDLPQLDGGFQMAGTHTITAVTDETCTITSTGHRGSEEAPLAQETGLTVGLGDSEAALTVDRASGWVLSKEQATVVSGQMKAPVPGKPDQIMTTPISVEITTTVTTVE